jgi:Na+-transporting NADH:ubiquinone oxidoreductase subunit NqrD
MQYLSLPLRNYKPRQENGDVTAVCFAVNVTINTPTNVNITSIIADITIITISNITINFISTNFPHSLRLCLVPLTMLHALQ